MKLSGSFWARVAVFLVFTATAFATNIVHVILLTVVKPISKRVYYQLVQYNNWSFMAQLIFLYQYWSSSRVTFYCKQSDYDALKHEKAFIIANHSHPINILLMMATLNQFDRLGNDISFGMACFKFIPFVGWHIYLAGHILLIKSLARDKAAIEGRLMEVAYNPGNVWVVLLPEGDQFNTENHSKAIRFALRNGMRPLMHHLTPRHKAFVITYEALKQLGGYSLINCHVAYESTRKPKFSNLLQGKSIKAHIYLERLDFDCTEPTFHGIYQLFQQQDSLHETFTQYNNFNNNGKLEDIRAVRAKNDPRVLINFLAWTLLWLCVVTWLICRSIAKAYKPELEKYSTLIVMIKIIMDILDIIAGLCRSATI